MRTLVELVGGAVDGEIVYPLFSLDLLGLSSCFDEVTDFRWHAHDLSPQASDGPHLTVEGVYQGHSIWVRVLSEPPEDEEPDLKLEVGPKPE